MATNDPNAPRQVVTTPTGAPVTATNPESVVVAPQPGQPVQIEQRQEPPRQEVDDYSARELVIYSHSPLFYWWPVWVVGYILAFVTRMYGERITVGDSVEYFNTTTNVGVIFLLTLFSVILVTNIAIRGLASAIFILTMILVTVLLAFFRLWDQILGWFSDLNIHMNFGAYFWFSTLLFITWLATVFILDRMSYYRIKPGQIIHQFVLGAASKSYDTKNLVFEKFRDDLFRHWILGLGSGDLRIHTYGAREEEIFVPNVLFIGSKIHEIQKLIATQPSKFRDAVVK